MTIEAKSVIERIEYKQKEIDELEDQICDYCDGQGEVVATEKIHSRIIDVPYKICPICNGTGIK